jgi:hypothetical protein
MLKGNQAVIRQEAVGALVRPISLILLAAIATGCATGPAQGGRGAGYQGNGSVNPQRIQAVNMGFADRYLSAMADEFDRVRLSAKTPQAAIMAQRLKILAGTDAMGNAVNPNPLVGLIDMALMVTLTHQIAQDKWVGEMFGPETAAALAAALKTQEADVWSTAAPYLTSQQVEEIHQLAVRWRAQHPGQRYIVGARLTDFSEAGGSSGEGGGQGVGAAAGAAAQQIAGSVFSVVTLDPFHGLDPAVKELAESRVLAERLFFYMRHTPILMSWQADLLFDQMLAQPQMMKLFADTTTVAGSTTRFSDATSRFSDASSELAHTVEKFRLQLPEQQTKLVAELNDLVARQREGALQQATTQVSVQREAAIQQLGLTVTSQQDLMTRNLQAVSDQSIDRLYQRARALVLITVGSIFLAVILYRLFVRAAPATQDSLMKRATL